MSEFAAQLFEALATGTADQLAAVLAAVHRISPDLNNRKPGSALEVEPGPCVNENTTPAQ
jgi:hypothetical protein